ncbi:MAG: multidrug effflux MFS transporter [Granulosicoccus sp.]|nr:multidrug effflux MFS transporter [Granulosicoccus sp.]
MTSPDEQLSAPPIWFLALCAASSVVGLTILTPMLPLMMQDLRVSSNAVQSLLTFYLVAIAVGQIIAGPMSDRWGRRPVMIVGTILYAIGSLVCALNSNIEILKAGRIVQGLGAAACMAMSRAIVNDVFKRSEAARQMSTIAMVLAVAPALSMAFAGLIVETVRWQGTMALLALLGIVMCVCAWSVARETNRHRLPRFDLLALVLSYAAVLGNTRFLCWALCSGMQVGVFFVLNGVLAYQYQRHGYSMAQFGLWFSLTPLFYIIGNSLNRSWFVARGLERAALIGTMLSLVSMVSIFTTQWAGLTHALSLALPCCLFGFSNGIVVANSTVGAISASSDHIGTASGIVGALQMATGGIAGAIIVALGGTDEFSIASLAMIVMCLISVVCMLMIFAIETNRRRQQL